jgi:hypothetical protein
MAKSLFLGGIIGETLKCRLHPLIHTFPSETSAQNIVGGSEIGEVWIKVIYTLGRPVRTVGNSAHCWRVEDRAPQKQPLRNPYKSNMEWNTLHSRHIFILFSQLPWTSPLHIVPLINQQRCPHWNSHAGHFSLSSMGQAWMSQQSLPPFRDFFEARRNSTCLSTCTETLLRPCS